MARRSLIRASITVTTPATPGASITAVRPLGQHGEQSPLPGPAGPDRQLSRQPVHAQLRLGAASKFNAVFADGHVQGISYSVTTTILGNLCNISDGNVIDPNSYSGRRKK